MAIAPEWVWLIGGVLLAIAEMLLPGVFLIWLGGAAIATGLIALATGVPLAAQLAIFTLVAILAVWAGHHVAERLPIVSDDPLLNEPVARLIGRTVMVVTAIEGGEGRVRVGDSVWTATGPDCAAGTRVEIVRAIGQRLVVELVPASGPALLEG